jgi:type I restriction enzyme S subunit
MMHQRKTAAIGEIVAPIRTWNPAAANSDGSFDYIDLSAVDQDTKKIVAARSLRCADAPSRARQLVEVGDILVSTVRPNLNGVASVPRELDGATSSTGFCVLRPEQRLVDSSYLFHWVKSPEFISDMVRRATGASYPAVSDRIVHESRLPLPPLPEQQRIAKILDAANALRARRSAALAQLDTLTQAIFFEMFGEPTVNPHRWPESSVDGIAHQVTDGEHLTPERTSDGIKLLSARNVRDGYIDFNNVDHISIAEHDRIKRRCNPVRGDVLISCSGTIGRVSSVETDEPFSLVRSVALIRPIPSIVAYKYLEHYLRTPAMQSRMHRSAHASSQANLFQGPIRALPVLVPPISLQQTFARRAAAVENLRTAHRASLAEMDALFASLQDRAFRGAL